MSLAARIWRVSRWPLFGALVLFLTAYLFYGTLILIMVQELSPNK
mgnify:CR=1 FL=1